jgi:diketogulonate reductase-like aldo/keto reductase
MATLPIALNDGTSIPWLGYGSGTALFNKDASESVAQAIKVGFRHIDAAQMYGNEDSVGAGIAASGVPRAELYVTTKLGQVPAGGTVRDTLVESLRKLQLDYVDLFLIHMPTFHSDLKGVWRELEAAKREGLTRSIGVSNFQPQHLKEILEVATIQPAVNQVRRDPSRSSRLVHPIAA